MPDDPHYIPPGERADGEPGEGGCLRAEAEEREAAESAPEILERYRARVREADEAINPPPDQPFPTQAAADMMARGEWPPIPDRAPLRAHFNQQLRRGEWIGFGFSEEQAQRVRVRSPWREELNYDDKGEMIHRRSRRAYSEVLFYRADPKPAWAEKTSVQSRTHAKARQAGVGAKMVAWFDALTPTQRKKTPNALADQYLKDPGRRGSKRYACRVFASPDKYRGRVGV